MKCGMCRVDFKPKRSDSKFCSGNCRQRNYDRGRRTYNADSIVVRDHANSGWEEVVALSEKYGEDEGIIERGLESCRMALVSTDYFIDRFLKKDKTIPFNKEVDIIYRGRLKHDQFVSQGQ